MRLLFFSFLTLLHFISGVFSASVQPRLRLIYPRPFSVITNNSMQMAVEVLDSAIAVKAVRFYAIYQDFIPSSEIYAQYPPPNRPILVGEVRKSPYELFWDCSKIPDQDVWRLYFYCTMEDSAGHLFSDSSARAGWVTIDRNPAFSRALLTSRRIFSPLRIDGDFSDWPASDSAVFNNNNNTVTCRSAWDAANLYFAVTVRDGNLHAPPDGIIPFHMYDCISLFFDPARDRLSVRQKDDRQIIMGVKDTVYGNIVYQDSLILANRPFLKDYRYSVRRQGTLGDDKDQDTGYDMEAAFTWAELGKKPRNGDSLGFDVFNTDNDFGQPWRIGKGFSGTEVTNNNNPSEWGTLVLTGKVPSRTLRILIAALLALVIPAAGLFLRGRLGGKTESEEAVRTAADLLTERIKEYVAGNYGRQELSLEVAAKELNVSGSHLRKTLKAVTEKGFSEYLAAYRIGKAKEALFRHKEKNITQIAFECGFNSPEYFNKIFKKLTGDLTPSEFRRRNPARNEGSE